MRETRVIDRERKKARAHSTKGGAPSRMCRDCEGAHLVFFAKRYIWCPWEWGGTEINKLKN